MLLAKAPPTPIPTVNLNSKHKHKPKWSPSWCNWKALHRDNYKLRGYENGVRLVVVRAGYTRTPMDTPGAYQLTDDETGEKFIVWGGVDDDHHHSPVPSKDVLSWNPKKSKGYQPKIHLDDHTRDTDTPTSSSSSSRNGNQGSTGTERMPVITNRDLPTTSAGGSAGNFGRLKAQRVRALVKKTSRMKQDISEDDSKLVVEDAPFGKSVSSHAKPEFIGRKKKENASRHERRVSRTSQSQDAMDVMQITGTTEYLDHSDVPLKQGFEPHSEYRITPDKPHKFDSKTTTPETLVPKRSAANLRGWGGGGPVHDFKTESADLLKQRRKLSTGSGSGFFSRKSFRDLGCTDYMIESLRGQLFLRPSNIQAMAFPPVIEGKSCIIADQSGSGKTLAYLAPIIQRLRQEELNALSKFSSQSPRVIILAPTAELASQVLSNCRSISKFGVPFKSMVVTGGFRQKTQLENLQQGVDVLIATPGRFMFLIKGGFLELTNLRCAVLDEVDILFNDDDFEGALRCLINSSPVATQYLFVTATLPVDIYYKLVEVFPDCEVIMGPGMHRISPGLEEVLVDCSGEDGVEKTPEAAFLNKKSAFLQLVERSPVSKTIVFCNKIDTCRKVENILRRFDRKGIRVQVLPFHAAVAQESRLANMKEFFRSQSNEVSQFLVCTDRASRGIDFAGVDHVVLFDFPRDPSEYVRRVGRTARGAGGKGKAFIFVVGKQVALARRITERNRKGHPLHDVPAAYELMS